MSQLILDASDPAVAEIVSAWEEGGQYRVELTITQGATKGSLVPFEVNEITDYGDAEAGGDGDEDTGDDDLAGTPEEVLQAIPSRASAGP